MILFGVGLLGAGLLTYYSVRLAWAQHRFWPCLLNHSLILAGYSSLWAHYGRLFAGADPYGLRQWVGYLLLLNLHSLGGFIWLRLVPAPPAVLAPPER